MDNHLETQEKTIFYAEKKYQRCTKIVSIYVNHIFAVENLKFASTWDRALRAFSFL